MKHLLKKLLEKLREIVGYLILLFLLYIAFNFFVNPSAFSARVLTNLAREDGFSGITKTVREGAEEVGTMIGIVATSTPEAETPGDVADTVRFSLFETTEGSTSAESEEKLCITRSVNEIVRYAVQNPFHPENGMSYAVDWNDGSFTNVDEETPGETAIVSHAYASIAAFDLFFTVSDGITAFTAERKVCVE